MIDYACFLYMHNTRKIAHLCKSCTYDQVITTPQHSKPFGLFRRLFSFSLKVVDLGGVVQIGDEEANDLSLHKLCKTLPEVHGYTGYWCGMPWLECTKGHFVSLFVRRFVSKLQMFRGNSFYRCATTSKYPWQTNLLASSLPCNFI